jgi:acetyl-CoA synthetase
MWSPSRERVETARVSALMRRLGVADLAELRRRSATEPDWFWRAVVDDLGIPFEHQFTRVLDESRGPEWATWFTDGTINQATACVGRWAADPVAGDRVALLAESEDGAVRRLTFRDLDDAVSQVAAALRASGLVSGGAVGVMMPMVPEAVVAMLGIARAGGVAVPVFSGFAAPAVAARMCDAGARIVLCADGAVRRGRSVPIRDVAERAAREAGCVDEIVVLGPAGGSGGGPIGVSWDAFLARAADASGEPAPTGAEDPVLLAYTSGTTGRPKGAVHVHGGLTVKVASEAAYALDIGAGERLLWLTDMGWIMGPWSMIGSLALGATMVLYDGAPDAPDPGRIWSLVERHRVTHLGVSPTLIRSLSGHGEGWAAAHDLSSLRIIGSTGEPWNPHGYGWLRARTEASDPPIINISWAARAWAWPPTCSGPAARACAARWGSSWSPGRGPG